jgi:hypothetical protein
MQINHRDWRNVSGKKFEEAGEFTKRRRNGMSIRRENGPCNSCVRVGAF